MIKHVVVWNRKARLRMAERVATARGAREAQGRRPPHPAARDVADAPATGRGAAEQEA